MLPDYDDIRALTPEQPLWFDGNGVPRYRAFDPQMLGVYDHVALLVKIECQSCRDEIMVGEGMSDMDAYRRYHEREDWEANFCEVRDDGKRYLSMDKISKHWAKHYHYGDPPSHGCAGDSMNCIDVEIVEAWVMQRGPKLIDWGWQRHLALEGPIEDD